MQKTLNILLPVLNEQDRLESGVRTLAAFMTEHNIPCILTIIDNGSTDATQEIALSLADSGGGTMDSKETSPNGERCPLFSKETARRLFSKEATLCHDFASAKSRNDDETTQTPTLCDSKILDEKCGLQVKSQGSYLSGDLWNFSPLPHFSLKAESRKAQSPIAIEYLRLNQKGVGLALQAGIDHNNSRQCKSAFIGYMDIDLSTNLCHLLEVYESLCAGSAVVVGSRLLQDSKVIGRSLKREIISKSLNAIIKAALHTSFSDAMCGFKFYQADIATLLRQKCSDDPSWFYCAQMLIQAQALGIEIEEIPVQWEDDPLGSKVQIVKLARIYLKEIYRLRPLRQAILAHKRSKISQSNAAK
ncbi:glycosyltransferase family 2 protein [Helicobacter canis]|uniref:Glycosyltransferase 2-like domain-containing protein n=1 Tax=Helicobacter canis NCTC 12740 TaxID=1357399 RepID=V8CJJ3_9HELI|nr:glycosyltransferase family 2 protein [Helicobacter canis]ETD27200.1 hypothetical protein HMPREF2087_00108 [Helicobacter canis NCTC 12740]